MSGTSTSAASPAWARSRSGAATLGLAAAWCTLIAWSGMVAEPKRFLVPALLIGAAIAAAGALMRALRVPRWAVPLGQLLVGLVGLGVHAARGQALFGLVPTPASVERTVAQLVNGAATLNTYSSPVQVNPTSTATLLTACGLGVILAVDVLALSVRRAPLAALPLLAALSVPVSILREGLALPVFVITALLFLRLLASDHLSSLERPSSGGWTGRPAWTPMTTFWQVSVAAVVAALLLTPLVPVSDLLKNRGSGDGSGIGNGFQLTTVNPFIRLRRDLVEKTHTPLAYATTESDSTGYLRTTVLDQFTGDEWRPSSRDLPSENNADGPIPAAPGLKAGINGTTSEWKITLDGNFSTSWLPTPYPVLEIDIGRGWRYDSGTLDVAYVSGGAPTPLTYSLTAFQPTLDAQAMIGALRPPASIREPMTRLPNGFPDVIREQAETVTKGAKSDFEKAVALQDWFRDKGGFTYSLDQRGGSGMDMLARFVTDDRVGYCEQFASAMAAMGRSLGIPSRVVVGFLDGTTQSDGRILYTSDERHAWPEMYFAGSGWVRFEPTSSQRAGGTPGYTQPDAVSPTPTAAPSATPSTAPSAAPDQAEQDLTGQDSTGISVPWRPIGVVLVLIALAVAPASLRRFQRRRRLRAGDPVHLAEGAWAELGATALDLGLDWPERRTPREQATRVSAQVEASPEDVASLEGLLAEVERGRYAPPGSVRTLEPETRARTVGTVDTWRQTMTASTQRGWRARWLPTSLLRRRPRE